MPLISSQEIESFFSKYYNTLIKTPSSLSNFFAENAQLSVSHENSESKTHTRDFDRVIKDAHRKNINKIMVVSYNHHTLANLTLVITIVQVCYDDSSNLRFVENFCIDENGLIVSSMIKFLNEEIVYSKDERRAGKMPINGIVSNSRNSLCIKNGARLSFREINDAFRTYGTVVGYERREGSGDAFIEFDSDLGVNLVIKNAKTLKERGIEIDQDKKYARIDAFERRR